MRYRLLMGAALAAATLTMSAVHAQAEEFHARLSGFNEVGALNAETGAILSGGTGTADVDLDKSTQTATYTLTFSGTFSSMVTQAHIHFGKVHVTGGVMVFFCSNLRNGPAGTPACPASGTVTGLWNPASVVLKTQGVTPGDFDALVEALESDTAYANIHTVTFPMGEIRGQIRRARGEDRE